MDCDRWVPYASCVTVFVHDPLPVRVAGASCRRRKSEMIKLRMDGRTEMRIYNKLSYNPRPTPLLPLHPHPEQQPPDPPILAPPSPNPRPFPPLLQLLIRRNRRSPKMTPDPGFSGSSRPDSTARRIDRARRMKGCVAFSPDNDDVSRNSTPTSMRQRGRREKGKRKTDRLISRIPRLPCSSLDAPPLCQACSRRGQ